MSEPFRNPFQQAKFFVTINHLKDLPAIPGAEVAFVGRSNAGKSSAINILANRTRLAYVSKTPGRTQHINFFIIGESRFLVDLPGYGFANAPGPIKQHWEGLVSSYLQTREQLRGLVLIMDARHPLKEHDCQLLAWFAPMNKPVYVLLTKCDKLSRQAKIETLRKVRAELAKQPIQSTVQLFSSLTREGSEEAITAIWKLLNGHP
jgi:GTP-binding protein